MIDIEKMVVLIRRNYTQPSAKVSDSQNNYFTLQVGWEIHGNVQTPMGCG
jgi:hypothetical protein